ncbi:MAG: 3'-5' exonuclease [Acholeplasmataceae bacterium]
MLKHEHILVFDFETTGLDARSCQIIEIGAVLLKKRVDQYEVLETLQLLVQTDEPLPPKITDITNITDEMLLRDGVTEQEAFNRLSALMLKEDTLLIAYNIQFDLQFLTALFHKYESKTYRIKHDILDAMAVYKDRNPYPHRLENAVAKYQVEVPNTHRALDDVMATLNVLVKMRAEKDNLGKYVNKIGYNKKYGVSGIVLPHVKYVAQAGGRNEIDNL